MLPLPLLLLLLSTSFTPGSSQCLVRGRGEGCQEWGVFECLGFVGPNPTGQMTLLCCFSARFPKDEVAHTVTESRVLQNTRHPFLTVSSADPCLLLASRQWESPPVLPLKSWGTVGDGEGRVAWTEAIVAMCCGNWQKTFRSPDFATGAGMGSLGLRLDCSLFGDRPVLLPSERASSAVGDSHAPICRR